MSPSGSSRLPSWRNLTIPSGLYPLRGISYFSTHPTLWPLLRTRLLPCFLLSLFVYANLFIWTYIPQVLFLALFHWNGLAWFNGAVLVLGEGAAIVALLFEAWFVDETQVDIFDAVLVQEGCAGLVREKRAVVEDDVIGEDGKTLSSVQRLGKHAEPKRAIYAPFSLRQIVEFVVLLPLNLIPWVGVPVFLILTGYRAGPFHHHRYYYLLGCDKRGKSQLIKRRQLRYTWFGTTGIALQLVPGLSMVFLLTTAVGAALWVRDLEKGKAAMAVDAQQDDHEQYTDNPV